MGLITELQLVPKARALAGGRRRVVAGEGRGRGIGGDDAMARGCGLRGRSTWEVEGLKAWRACRDQPNNPRTRLADTTGDSEGTGPVQCKHRTRLSDTTGDSEGIGTVVTCLVSMRRPGFLS